jgi:polysaccharide biosynthesis transport protein
MGDIYDEVLVAVHGVWRRRWLALAVAWGIGLLGWFFVSLIPNTYESKAKILVQANTLLPDRAGITPGEQRSAIETVRQTLTSVENLQKVVKGTELAKHVASDRDIFDKAAALQSRIEIKSVQDNLFEISATASEGSLSDAQNARLSTAIVQKLIDLFVDGSLRDGRQEAGQSMTFLDAQIAQRGEQLAQLDARRAAFEAKFLSTLPGGGTLGERISSARSELSRVSSDLSAANSALAAVNGQLAGTPATNNTPGSMVSTSDGRVAQIQGQIADGQARGWTEAHPDMVALKSQLARAQAMGGGGSRMTPGSSTPNPMFVTLRSMQAEKVATASALSARKSQLEGEINRILALQTSNPEFSQEQTAIDRDYQALKAQYDKLVSTREEVRLRGQVQTQTDAVRFNVIDPPSEPRIPDAPNRPLLLTIVLLAAIGGGLGAAFAFGQVKTTYPTAAKLEKASGLPVIGSITEVVRAPERLLRRKRRLQFAGGAAALVGLWAVLMVAEFVQRSMVA